MIDLKSDVLNALRGDMTLTNLLGGPYVWQLVAGDPNQYPRITFFEIDNSDSEYADDTATASSLYFQIDIWDKRPRPDILDAVDRVMKSIGFKRTSAGPDLFEPDTGVVHKPPRYRIAKTL